MAAHKALFCYSQNHKSLSALVLHQVEEWSHQSSSLASKYQPPAVSMPVEAEKHRRTSSSNILRALAERDGGVARAKWLRRQNPPQRRMRVSATWGSIAPTSSSLSRSILDSTHLAEIKVVQNSSSPIGIPRTSSSSALEIPLDPSNWISHTWEGWWRALRKVLPVVAGIKPSAEQALGQLECHHLGTKPGAGD